MAGGTGGHVFPALAVAKELQAKDFEIHWLGTHQGLEATIVPTVDTSIKIHYISITGLRRTGIASLLLAPFRLLFALLQALQILTRLKPDVVLGMGGFVSGPGGLAAFLLRRPLIIHEQNAIPGFTNRILARFSKNTLEAFPGSFNPKVNAVYSGNPVRKELLDFKSPQERFHDHTGPMRILVLGGSRGARALNEICPVAFQEMKERLSGGLCPDIWHQTGKGNAEATRKIYEGLNIQARVVPFVDDMAEAYEWADLIICRSGAITVSELAAVGIGSILIPYPFAVDDHQTHNGRFLESGGGAILIPQTVLKPKKLANLLFELSQNKERVIAMAKNAYKLAKRDAAKVVSTYCEEVCDANKK